MALPNKRLQRKTTVAKTDHGEQLAESFTSWMDFLLQDHGKLHQPGFILCRSFERFGNWRCVKHFRILNKKSREIWEDVFQIRLLVFYGYQLARLRSAFPRDSVIFYQLQDTHTPNQILCRNKGRGCVLTVPWQAFINFQDVICEDPIFSVATFQDVILRMPSTHYLVPQSFLDAELESRH